MWVNREDSGSQDFSSSALLPPEVNLHCASCGVVWGHAELSLGCSMSLLALKGEPLTYNTFILVIFKEPGFRPKVYLYDMCFNLAF